MIFKSIVLFFFAPLLLSASLAQTPLQDSIQNDLVIKNAIALYSRKVASFSPLYRGREYVGYSFRIKGDQFFASNDWETGSVFYAGVFYDSVSLMYDLVKDELLVNHPDNSFIVVLKKDLVSYFTLSGHHFVHLTVDDRKDFLSMNGFFDQLNSGKVRLLVKRKKFVDKEMDNSRVHRSFKSINKFFIQKDGQLNAIKSKRSVLKLFDEQAGYIRKELKKAKVKYRQDPEYAIAKMIEYYQESQSK